jgi:hypothetical protein
MEVAKALEKKIHRKNIDLQSIVPQLVLSDHNGGYGAVDLGYDRHHIPEDLDPLIQTHVLERTLVVEYIRRMNLYLVEFRTREILLLEPANPAIHILPGALVNGQRCQNVLRLGIRAIGLPGLIDIGQIQSTAAS